MAEAKTGRYVQVVKKGGPLELVTREVPEPGAGQVRVRVQACGVCHSDSVTMYGVFPGFSIRGCRGMRSWARWTPSAKA